MVAKMGANDVHVVFDETVDGSAHFLHTLRRPEGRIHIHPDQSGLYLLDTLLHEAIHASCHFRYLKVKHPAVYALAADLAEFLITMKLLDPTEVEAKLRLNVPKAEEAK